MRYAEVSVNSPVARRRTFSYSIPDNLSVSTGQAVLVPFGERVLQGIVIALSSTPAVAETRDILSTIEPEPVLSLTQIKLAQWISEYYLSPLFDAVALFLPPGFARNTLTFLSLAPDYERHDLSSLSPELKQATDIVRKKERINFKEIERNLGKEKAQKVVAQLVRCGILSRQYELEPVKIKPKRVPYLTLTVNPEQARTLVTAKGVKSRKQASLLLFLAEQAGAVPWKEAKEKAGIDRATANALAEQGLIRFTEVEVTREPISYKTISATPPLKLTPAQETAFTAIRDALHQRKFGVFLLHGVTGSGKTEIYLQALSEAVKIGRKGIMLVPEIALTPQTIERFAARFPRRVAVLHSKLTPGEQFDEWRRIKNGEFDVVIGPRSAIFAPQPDLGLIVIDEEHEWTYKQDDKSPRYHARDVALRLAELIGAVVVLGSATPDVTTYYHAQTGDFHLLHLPERVVPSAGAALPEVSIIDMREELKAGNRSVFSRPLAEAISRALAQKEQVILFLNRRGGATFVQCRHCGFVMRCKRCDVPLTYHPAEDRLICHLCNYKASVPEMCPRCMSRQIKFLGTGTQKLEEEVRAAFPRARLLRWDSDVTRSRESHEAILSKFRAHEANILIGTQMVAKGLDIPAVTLVGVINADTSLNLPDFRAGERTFQLLSQVAGRAGRGVSGGQVIIQTFSAEHYAIQAAGRHDYQTFYEKEIEYRRQFRNPPFSQLALLTYTHTNEARCQREAERMKQVLITESEAKGIADLTFIGPAPAFISRLRGRFRWQLILRGSNLSAFLAPIAFPQGWTADIDPVSLL